MGGAWRREQGAGGRKRGEAGRRGGGVYVAEGQSILANRRAAGQPEGFIEQC